MTPSERLVSTLPWMDNFSNIRSYDFDYTLDGSRVEVKGCKKATALPSGYDGITLQVSFGPIDPNKLTGSLAATKTKTSFGTFSFCPQNRSVADIY
jgi:hypothetical protein